MYLLGLDYNPKKMKRFAIEHLPRSVATYQVTPVDYDAAQTWLAAGDIVSLVRTTEMKAAIGAGLGVTLDESDTSVELSTGDEALLISLSFSVLLAWAEGSIVPLPEDWRCLLLHVGNPRAEVPALEAAARQDLASSQ